MVFFSSGNDDDDDTEVALVCPSAVHRLGEPVDLKPADSKPKKKLTVM